MNDLQGEAPLLSSPPVLAYLSDESGNDPAGPQENARLHEDSVDGDVIEATLRTELETLRRADASEQATFELRSELEAARAEANALRESLAIAHNPELSVPEPADAEDLSRL